MKKIAKYTFLIFTVCSFIFTQNIAAQTDDYAPGNITWGVEHNSPGNSRMSKIIGTNNKGFYSLRVSRSSGLSGFPNYLIEQFNNKNKVVKSKEIEMKYKKKRRDFENILLLGDKIFLFTSFFNAAKNTKYLFAETLSSVSLKQRNDIQMIGQIENNKEKRGVFDFSVSEDSSKVMIYHNLPYKRKEKEKFAFNIYDSNFEKLWSKEVTLPYNDDRFRVNEYIIDNEGNAYVLGQISISGMRTNGRDQTITAIENTGRNSTQYRGHNQIGSLKYAVLAYRNQGERFKEYQIALDGKLITDLTMKISSDGNLTCAGFYSKNQFNIEGTCFFRIDAETEKVIASNINEFEVDFLTEYLTDLQKKRVAKGKTVRSAEISTSYALDDLILRSDGGAVLIAEQFFIDIDDFNDIHRPGRNRTAYIYNYNDIIVININPDGTTEWASRIQKNQKTIDDNGYFSSYSMAVVKDRMYFVYNDNHKNFEEKGKFRRFPYSFNGKNSVITLSEINQNGEVIKYILGKNKDEKILTRPKVCQQTGLYEMVILGERYNKFKFGTLKFRPK